jgi:hypothetical protein
MRPPLVPFGSDTRGGPRRHSAFRGFAKRERGALASRYLQRPGPTWEIPIAPPRERLTLAVQPLCCHHDAMSIARPVAAVLIVVALAGVAGCASPDPVVAPVVRDAGDLQGATVELEVGQVLDIDTGDLAVDSYSGVVSDPSVATFTPGREENGATLNPGVEALAEGTTEVVLSNADGGIQDVTFTVEVSD